MHGLTLLLRNIHRLTWPSLRVMIAGLVWLLPLQAVPALAQAQAQAATQTQPAPIRFGMTPAVLHNQYGLLADWRKYLEQRLQRPVEIVLRDSYRDTIDLLKELHLEFAWVSDYPYVYLEDQKIARLLATPVYKGRPYYRAYLIVPAAATNIASMQQLKGGVFAYADPYSHTGYILPRFDIGRAGGDPDNFFRRTYFTGSHYKLIEAVGGGYADGASVDSFVWDTLARIHPALTSRTRIVGQSPEFGFPPIVAAQGVAASDYAAMQHVLLTMAADPVGAALLSRLNIDGFGPGDTRIYNDVRIMAKAMGAL